MEPRHDSIHSRHPVRLQVPEEPDVFEADNSGVRERSGVLGRRLDPSKVHDLGNPYQARGRVPLHPHPAVKVDPLYPLVFSGKPRTHRLQKGDKAFGGEN